jgi:hypothetical protein
MFVTVLRCLEIGSIVIFEIDLFFLKWAVVKQIFLIHMYILYLICIYWLTLCLNICLNISLII